MRVVIAPDSFKGSASAADAARALRDGWLSVRPGDDVQLLPMADGGEGTLDAFLTAIPGAQRILIAVTGPMGDPVETSWVLLPPTATTPGGTGVVELACTSGMTLLKSPEPLTAQTTGFGQAIAHALDHGVTNLLLAIGGSSSTDAGAGALTGLGARFLDQHGRQVPAGGRGLAAASTVDMSGLVSLPPGGARILSDVTNPMLGPTGAAAVFAPQKGANQSQVAELERALAHVTELMQVDPQTAGSGAAGGTGFGLLAWGAEMASGAQAVGVALGLPEAVANADMVITGEGQFDAQSAAGKVPAYLLELAQSANVPLMLVAGSITAPTADFARALSLTALAGSGKQALAEPLLWLRKAGAALADGV